MRRMITDKLTKSIKEVVNAYNEGEFTAVEANPATTTETLTGIEINGTGYAVGGGTEVSGTNDGTNWTTLTVGNDTYNIPQGGGGGNQLYRHHIQIFKADSSTYNCECVIYTDIINNSNTEITSVATILSILDAGVTATLATKGVLANGIMKDGANIRDIIEIKNQTNIQTSIKELVAMYKDTSNVYTLTNSINIPTDADVKDTIYTL